MAKSKVRGGKKAHKAKVDARNQKLKSAQSAIQKLFNETMKLQMEEFQKKSQENPSTSNNPEK